MEDQRGRRIYLATVGAARLHSRGSGVRPESGARPTWGFRGPCVGSGCGSGRRSDPVSVVGTFQRQETPVPIDSSCARPAHIALDDPLHGGFSARCRHREEPSSSRVCSSCSKPQSGVPNAPTSSFGSESCIPFWCDVSRPRPLRTIAFRREIRSPRRGRQHELDFYANI